MTKPILPNDALDERLAIVGTAGAGKTYLARHLQERLLKIGARTCWIDALGVAWGIKSSADGKSDGFPVVIFGGRHADVPITEHMGAAVGELIARASYSSVIDLDMLGSDAARRRFVLAFLDSLYEAKRRQGETTEPLHLIFDEADKWAPQHILEKDGGATNLLGKMQEIVRRGRVAGFIPWLITQRPAVLNKNVLSQADTLIALKLTSAQDRSAIGTWIDGQADAAESKRILADLPRLPRGTGYVWAPAHGILERKAFPKITTFDSSATPKRGAKSVTAVAFAKVDIEGIRNALESIAPDPAAESGKSKSKAASAADVEAAEKRGYERAWADCLDAVLPSIDSAFEACRKSVHEAFRLNPPLYAKVLAQSIGEPVSEVVRDLDRALVKRTARSKPASGASSLLATAVRHHPARLTWSILAQLNGRKARGGHFNTEKRRMLDAGYVREDGGAVVVTDDGFAEAGARPSVPADLTQAFRDALPGLSGRIFAELLKPGNERMFVKRLAAALGCKPHGGHWNTGLATLQRCDLIRREGDDIVLNKETLA